VGSAVLGPAVTAVAALAGNYDDVFRRDEAPSHLLRDRERLIGSMRRESLDHLIVFDEVQLRRVLRTSASHYNRIRTHLSLKKSAPNIRHPRTRGAVAVVCGELLIVAARNAVAKTCESFAHR